MDNSIPPSIVDNGFDPFEQRAALFRQSLDDLRALYDQRCGEIEHLRQEASRSQADTGQLQAELAEVRQKIAQLEASATTAQVTGERPVAEDTLVPMGTAARRKNVELRNRIKGLEAELAALQHEPAEPSEIESLREKTEQLKRTIEENEAKLAVLQTELDAAGEQLEARGRELETKREEISRLSKSLDSSKKNLSRTRQSLDAERATTRDLHQALDAATQNERAIRDDLEVCKSSRDQLARQADDLQTAVCEERDRFGWEVATRLTAVLVKLSILADLEPEQVQGLSKRAVFEEFRTELGRVAGGRLEWFPSKHELPDKVLWLDVDQKGLEALQARYDWSPERPFEGLLPGSRRISFRLSRHGWSIGDRVLQRAYIVPVPLEREPTLDIQQEEPLAEPEQIDADQPQG